MRRPWLLLVIVAVACTSADTPEFLASDPRNPKVAIARDDLSKYCAAARDVERVRRDLQELGSGFSALRLAGDQQQLQDLAGELDGRTKELVQNVAAAVASFAEQVVQSESVATPEFLNAFGAFDQAIGFMPGCGGV